MAISTYSMLKNVFSKWEAFQKKLIENTGYLCLDAEIRLNWECNANCKMCGLSKYISENDPKRKQNLNITDIRNLLSALKKLGCSHVTFSGGEPTLSPILIDCIKCAVENEMLVAINTNGYLLNEGYIKNLIDAGVKIFTFSIDSPIEEQQDEIRGLRGCYKSITNAIDVINEYNNKSSNKVFVLVNCVLLKENIRNIHMFTEFYKKHHFDHINLSPASIQTKWDQWTVENNSIRTSIMDVRYFKKEVYPLLKNYDWPFHVEDPYEDDNIENNIHSRYSYIPLSCFIPFLHTVIQSNGDVIPCCYANDNFIMGNIKEKSLEEIWNNEKYKTFREKVKTSQLFEMCQSCRQYMKINDQIYKKLESRR